VFPKSRDNIHPHGISCAALYYDPLHGKKHFHIQFVEVLAYIKRRAHSLINQAT
jgi:hypothetical protein